jgi:hypothetical protein
MKGLEMAYQGGSPLVSRAGGPLSLRLEAMGGPPGSLLPSPSTPPPPRSEWESDAPEAPKTTRPDGNKWDVADLLLSPGDEDYESLLGMGHYEADTSEPMGLGGAGSRRLRDLRHDLSSLWTHPHASLNRAHIPGHLRPVALLR